jgi:hypothetical protein
MSPASQKKYHQLADASRPPGQARSALSCQAGLVIMFDLYHRGEETDRRRAKPCPFSEKDFRSHFMERLRFSSKKHPAPQPSRQTKRA